MNIFIIMVLILHDKSIHSGNDISLPFLFRLVSKTVSLDSQRKFLDWFVSLNGKHYKTII